MKIKGKDKKNLKSNHEETRVKLVETIVFIPTTPESKPRKRLQEVDNDICKVTDSPTERFIERDGPKVIETVGRTNSGAKD